MANSGPDQSESYEQLVEQLEDKFGREICGAPTEAGEPCRKWPVEGGGGRCRGHAGNTNDPEESTSGEPGPVNLTSPLENHSSLIPLGLPGLLFFVIVGLVLGAAVTSAGVYYFQRNDLPSEKTSGPVSENQLDVDLSDPDFDRVRQFHRQGSPGRIAVFLQKILDESDQVEVRAKAAYHLFVFYQQQEEYRRALELVEMIRKNHPDFDRLPEVLYGGWYLADRHLEDPGRAERYRKLLKNEYPDSRWTSELQ